MIQTYNPDHYAIAYAKEQNYKAFAEKELHFRNMLHYPPFWRIARFLFSHKDETYLKNYLCDFEKAVGYLKNSFQQKDLIILGPTITPLPKIKQTYRQHLILKARDVTIMNKAITYLKSKNNKKSSVKITIDVDPFQLL